jgi:hypothetical protein
MTISTVLIHRPSMKLMSKRGYMALPPHNTAVHNLFPDGRSFGYLTQRRPPKKSMSEKNGSSHKNLKFRQKVAEKRWENIFIIIKKRNRLIVYIFLDFVKRMSRELFFAFIVKDVREELCCTVFFK